MIGTDDFDIAIIGAGMAGASLAAELATDRTVVLLEAEDQPGFHATGRSAALFAPFYGNATIRSLTAASSALLSHPPDGFSDQPLLKPRGCLTVARDGQQSRLFAMAAEIEAPGATDAGLLDAAATRRCAPLLAEGYAAAGLLDPSVQDIDVNALHAGYLRQARARGVVARSGWRFDRADRSGRRWRLETSGGPLQAELIVNAAGAWADVVASACGVSPLGCQPCRRTVVCVDVPDVGDTRASPFILDLDETLYIKPETGRLLISPGDETPTAPADAQPEEIDVAIAIDRFERATGRPVRRVISKWAGLRTFVSDRSPVVGFDTTVPHFFWLAAQGGYGIQIAPATASLAARLIEGRATPAEAPATERLIAALAPDRLRSRTAGTRTAAARRRALFPPTV